MKMKIIHKIPASSIVGLGIAAVVFLLVWTLRYTGVISSYILQIFEFACINIMMTVSLQMINGYMGEFSIGHAGFMSIGAYVSGVITTLLIPASSVPAGLQLPFFLLSLIVGSLAAGLAALLIGIPSFRLSGDYLAIITLGFGEIIRAAIRAIPAVGAARGLSNIPSYTSYPLIFVITLLTIVFTRNFVNSPFGRSCVAVRENSIAADTLGINVYRQRLKTFVIAAMIAGVAGGLFAHLYGFIQPDQFSMLKSTDYVVFVYAGGVASISGSIISALVLTCLPEVLRFTSEWRLPVYAVLLIIIMLRRPNGLLGGKEFLFLRTRNFSYQPVRQKTNKEGKKVRTKWLS